MLSRWPVKCAIDTAKALLPFQRQLRRHKDYFFGYCREPLKDARTIRDGLLLINWLGGVSGLTVIEMGTGWQPMIPILLSLAGANVLMADLHRLMRHDTFRAALDAIRENRDAIASALHLDPEAIEHAAREGPSIAQRLMELRLVDLAPCDCRRLKLADRSMDVLLSRAVLEHVVPADIAAIFQEAHRILRPGGLMIHLIDHSDHWSHQDHHISAVNFLKYPDWLFRWTCINPQNYQNRLRHSEYIALIETAGFVITRDQRIRTSDCADALSGMRVAERFRRFAPDDLATTTGILLAEAGRPASA